MACVECGTELIRGKRGPAPRYCSNQCRARACTRRAAESGRKTDWDEASRQRRIEARPERACQVCGCPIEQGSGLRTLCGEACRRKNAARRIAPHVQLRRARMAGVDAEPFTAREVYERDAWTCGICGESVDPEAEHPDPRSPSLDHVTPLSLGGPHTRGNTRLAHLICNVRRGNRVVA